jgi:hypothetical protein
MAAAAPALDGAGLPPSPSQVRKSSLSCFLSPARDLRPTALTTAAQAVRVSSRSKDPFAIMIAFLE